MVLRKMFQIPISDEDLLQPKEEEYNVATQVSLDDLHDKLREFGRVMREAKAVELTSHFDTFFTVVNKFSEVNSGVRHIAWGLIIKCLDMHIHSVSAYIREVIECENEEGDDERSLQLNTTQMVVYLVCRLASLFESQAKEATVHGTQDDDGWDWVQQKAVAITKLASLLSVSTPLDNGTRVAGSLRLLWDPPHIDATFIKCICDLCGVMLEHPQVNLRLYEEVKEGVFAVWRTIVHEHDMKFSSVICESVRDVMERCSSDHLGDVLADGLACIAQANPNFVRIFARELAEIDESELRSETSKLAKTLSQLLSKLVKLCPTEMLPSVAPLTFYLDQESYQLRSAVLTVMAELCVAKLTGEDLTNPQRTTRNEIILKLHDHTEDVNALVRVKCINLWKYMMECKAVPLAKLAMVVARITKRLMDKSVLVRKAALGFLTACLCHNPFGDKMDMKEIAKELEEATRTLTEFNGENPANNRHSEAMQFAMDAWSRTENQVKQAVEIMSVDDIEDDDDLLSKRGVYTAVSHGQLASAVACVMKMIKDSHPELHQFAATIHSFHQSPPSEQNECLIEVVKQIYLGMTVEDRIEEGEEGVEDENSNDEHIVQRNKLQSKVDKLKDKHMFACHMEKSLPSVLDMLGNVTKTDAEELANFVITCAHFKVAGHDKAVRRLFYLTWRHEVEVQNVAVGAFNQLFLFSEENPMLTARSLINIVDGANEGELASMEKVLAAVVKEKQLSDKVTDCLWQIFCRKCESTDVDAVRAILIIAMAANANPKMVSANIVLIVKHGLADDAVPKFALPEYCFYALTKLVPHGKDANSKQETMRLNVDHCVFDRLTHILVDGIVSEDTQWTPMMERGITMLFSLAEGADGLAANMIKLILVKFVDAARNATLPKDALNRMLMRLLSLTGQCALKITLLIDVTYQNELKRRASAVKELRVKRLNSLNSSMNDSLNQSLHNDDMNLATAEDVEIERLGTMLEECMQTQTTMGKILPLVLKTCSPSTASTFSSGVQIAGALCLSKMMILSESVCEEQLRLLFTLLERSKLSVVRANAMVAAGDLCFRFPNLVQPYGVRMYDRLADPADTVRHNCLLVLSHLILNEMLKVHGQVAQIALVIQDDDHQMAALAKRFFTELARKDNKLYNLLPDIISRLSDPKTRTDYDRFKNIMKFLLVKIEKEKHIENVVDKLCQRIQAASTVEEWRYFSYCISQMPIHERTLRRLQENLPKLADKLADNEVFLNFENVISNAGKYVKSSEAKSDLAELEDLLKKLHANRANNEQIAENAISAFKRNLKKSLSPKGKPLSFKTPVGKTPGGKTPRRIRVKSEQLSPS